MVHVRRSEDNLWEFVFSFHHVGSSNRTRIECPGSPSWLTSFLSSRVMKNSQAAVTGVRYSRTPSPLPKRKKKNHRGRIVGGLAFSLVLITRRCSVTEKALN